MEAVLEMKKPQEGTEKEEGVTGKSDPWVVLEDGRKVSRTWAAFLDAEKNPWIEIVDMDAVIYGVYDTDRRR